MLGESLCIYRYQRTEAVVFFDKTLLSRIPAFSRIYIIYNIYYITIYYMLLFIKKIILGNLMRSFV